MSDAVNLHELKNYHQLTTLRDVYSLTRPEIDPKDARVLFPSNMSHHYVSGSVISRTSINLWRYIAPNRII